MKLENHDEISKDIKIKNSFIYKFEDKDAEMIADYSIKYPEMNRAYLEFMMDQYLTFVKKNLDYGPDNISFGTKLENEDEINASLKGIFIRLWDKSNRLKNLVYLNKERNVKDENVDDTYGDIANYAIYSRMVMKGKWNK